MKTKDDIIRVLLADDHAIVRAGLAAVLGFENGITVVGEAADGEAAVRLAIALKPDVVIMDLMMPKLDGAEATAAIRRSCPATKILLLTTYGTSVSIRRALAAGATGAVTKTVRNEELTAAIRAVAAGEQILTNDIRQVLDETDAQPDLTQRQLEILHSVARGLTNQDIATRFGITISGVKQHLNAIFVKLGASNRSEAVTIALKSQMIEP